MLNNMRAGTLMTRRRAIAAFLAGRDGGTAAIAALVVPLVVLFTGLGVSVGAWLDARRDLQTQADAGALAAKNEQMAGATTARMNALAEREVRVNGFAAAVCPSAECVVGYPVSGPLGDTRAVEVRVSRAQPLFFAGLLPGLRVNVGARATAEAAKTGDACVLALDPDNAGAGVTLWGNSTINFRGCVIAANQINAGAVSAGGNSTVYAQSVYTSGGYIQSGSADMVSHFQSNPITGAPPLADPYATLGSDDPTLNALHAAAPVCDAAHTNLNVTAGTTRNLAPGVYCGSWDVHGNLNLAPGVYYIFRGSLTVNATAVVRGTGVTIVMTSTSANPGGIGAVRINGGAILQLSPPPPSTTASPARHYIGVVFYYDRIATGNPTLLFNGGTRMNLVGAIYAPSATLNFVGNSGAGASTCTKLVSYNLVFSGTAETNVDLAGCDPVLGTTGTTTVYDVRLTR